MSSIIQKFRQRTRESSMSMGKSRKVCFVAVLALVVRVGEPRSVEDGLEDAATKKSSCQLVSLVIRTDCLLEKKACSMFAKLVEVVSDPELMPLSRGLPLA